MRLRYFAVVIVMIFSLLVAYGQTVEQANDAYETGNYSAAIGLYEQAIAQGDADASVYYNLASAYYLDGQLGEALLNYRRAELYFPRDEAISERIELIRGERIDDFGDEVGTVAIIGALTASVMTLTELSAIVFTIWVIFFLVLAVGIRRRWWVVIGIFAIVMLIGVGLLGARWVIDVQQPSAVVIVEDVDALSGPGDIYLTLFSLYEAAEIRVIEVRDGWVRFVLADGRQGWIRADSVGLINSSFP